jgi:hypothetical protein
VLIKQWILGWLTDCHKTAFGEGFSPTQEVFSSKNYHEFCEALCSANYSNDDPVLSKTIIDRLSKLYLLLTSSLVLQNRGRDLIDEDESEIRSIILGIELHFMPFTSHRFFCSDDSGRLAWVPKRAQTGDVLVVFLGAKVPHLLRLVADGRYKLIGACYLHGCMNDEVIEADQFTVEEFLLV